MAQKSKKEKNKKESKIEWHESVWLKWLFVVLFGVGFALVEAAVVIHLRRILSNSAWVPEITTADIALGLPYFLLLKAQAFKQIFPDQSILNLELWREAATILMLLTVGWLAGRNWPQRIGAFLIAFGIWDIFYYVFLFVFISWPSSLATPDLLFLIPLPWIAPVWLPAAISVIMVSLGTSLLWKHQETRPFRKK